MKVKVKKTNKDGIVRLETQGEIQEVLVNEDIFDPGKESISLCFRGEDGSSGIIDLTTTEFDKLQHTLKDRIHLIKGMKKLKG